MRNAFSFVLFRTLRPKVKEQMVRSVNLKSSLLPKLFLYVEKLTQVCRPPSAEFSLLVQELPQILGDDSCRRSGDVLEIEIAESLCELFHLSLAPLLLAPFQPTEFLTVCHTCRAELGGLFGATEEREDD